MAIVLPITEIVAGDRLNVTLQVPAYPASGGNTLTLRLVPRATGTAVDLTATASGDDHVVSASAAATAAYAAGEYSWHAFVTNGSDRYTVGSGQITVKANPASLAAGADTRSQARKAVDDLKAALAAWSPTRKSYTVGDVSMTFNSTGDIVRMLNFWERELAREEAAVDQAAGRKPARRVFMRSARG